MPIVNLDIDESRMSPPARNALRRWVNYNSPAKVPVSLYRADVHALLTEIARLQRGEQKAGSK